MITSEVEYAHSLQWQREDLSAILCAVKFKHFKRELPYSACINDCEETGRMLYMRCVSGEYGEIKPYKEQEPVILVAPVNKEIAEQRIENTNFSEIQKLLDVVNSENSKKSFRSVVIVWGAYIEQQIKELIEKKKETSYGNINSRVNFEKKIDTAYRLGIISGEEAKRCHLIRKIRNILAHEAIIDESKELLSLLKDLYDLDHSDLFEYIVDIEYLLQMICAGSCGRQAFQLTRKADIL